MAERTRTHWIGRFLADACLGLALFVMMAGLASGDGGARAAAGVSQDSFQALARDDGRGDVAMRTGSGMIATDTAWPQTTMRVMQSEPASKQSSLAALAIAFSLLFALNLGFFRHLRRTAIESRMH